jgi:hypothetical protein
VREAMVAACPATIAMYHIKRLLARFVPDPLYVRLAYLKSHGRLPRTPPVTFNDHLCALKSSGDLAAFQGLADKNAVRDHVARKGLAQHLVPLHATADRLTREVWDGLPESFVVKTNHGSNWNRIIRSKREENYDSIASLFNNFLKRDFYFVRREHQYRNIRPVIMFEELLEKRDGEKVDEYKFFCFSGKVGFILVPRCKRYELNDYYDPNWIRLDISRRPVRLDPLYRPEMLDEMINVAEVLSEGFIFVRVDLYNIERCIYFGELTFVPGGGSGRFRSLAFEKCAGRLWAGEEVDLTPFHSRRQCAPA